MLREIRERLRTILLIRKICTFPYNELGWIILYKGIITLSDMLPPVLYMLLINEVIINKEWSSFRIIIVSYLSVFIGNTVIRVLLEKKKNTFFEKLKIITKKSVLNSYTKMERDVYLKYSAGDLVRRLEADIEALDRYVNNHLIDFFFSIVTSIVISVVLVAIDIKLGIIGLVLIPLSFLMAAIIAKKTNIISSEYRQIYGEYESFIHNGFHKWKDIKAYNIEDFYLRRFTNYWNKLFKLFIKKQIYEFANNAFVAFKDFFLTNVNLYLLGGILILVGKLSIGSLIMYMNYYSVLLKHVEGITSSIVKLSSDRESINRVMEILLFKSKVKENVTINNSLIQFEEVDFYYSGNCNPVLKNLNLTIQDRSKVVIVGESGGGKSTLVKLVSGVLTPQKGAVKIGDYNINNISPQSIGKKVAIVMQQPFLFNLSIKENLLLAKRSASMKEIEMVCKKANIFDYIYNLPQKYDTVIGEKGGKMSGGQIQRLSIARALLQNVDIFIFDEPTAALDYENEIHVMDNLNQLLDDKTVIYVSHRISTISRVKDIIILEKGKVVFQDSVPAFYEMFKL